MRDNGSPNRYPGAKLDNQVNDLKTDWRGLAAGNVFSENSSIKIERKRKRPDLRQEGDCCVLTFLFWLSLAFCHDDSPRSGPFGMHVIKHYILFFPEVKVDTSTCLPPSFPPPPMAAPARSLLRAVSTFSYIVMVRPDELTLVTFPAVPVCFLVDPLLVHECKTSHVEGASR